MDRTQDGVVDLKKIRKREEKENDDEEEDEAAIKFHKRPLYMRKIDSDEEEFDDEEVEIDAEDLE